MFTLKKNAVVSFDGDTISLLTDGVLVLREPASVIRKKSETPVGVAYGDEAEAMKNELSENQLYCKPFKNGKIADESGARIIFRAVLRKVFGKNPFVSVRAIVSGGLSDEEREEVLRAFSYGGYTNVTLVPRPVLLAKLAELNERNAVLYMDADVTEAVLVKEGEILSSVTTNVGTTTLGDRVRDYLAEESKLLLTADDGKHLAQNGCSLFEDDTSVVTVKGKDAITALPKSVQFSSRDLYHLTYSVYKNVTNTMQAIIFDTDRDFGVETIKKGILCLGSGVRISGFSEFWKTHIGTPASVIDDRVLLLALAEIFSSEDE